MAEDKSEKKEDKSGEGKWWEFYLVRYALGTVFGVLIVNALVKSGLAVPFPDASISEIGKPEGYPLLIAYGLAYCYLSSAPILVFHASRFAMRQTGVRPSTIGILAVSALAAIAWWSVVNREGFTAALFVSSGITIGSVCFILLTQVRALYHGMTNPGGMWEFYRRLDENRRNSANKELIDSYRHLREHGNAFFVVLLELLLGLGLYVAGKVSLFPPAIIGKCVSGNLGCDVMLTQGVIQTISVIAIWVVPGAAVWGIGCLLEAQFASDATIGTQVPAALSGTNALVATVTGTSGSVSPSACPGTSGSLGTGGRAGSP